MGKGLETETGETKSASKRQNRPAKRVAEGAAGGKIRLAQYKPGAKMHKQRIFKGFSVNGKNQKPSRSRAFGAKRKRFDCDQTAQRIEPARSRLRAIGAISA